MKKACLMITGQMRTYYKCFTNQLEMIINENKHEYEFHIVIFTEYYGKNGGSQKNNFTNEENEYNKFKMNIEKIYGKYLKNLIIETFDNKINYPEYLNGYGPWIVLYRNKYLFDKINGINEYDIFIRLRPDIVLSNKISLNNINISKKIVIICGQQRNDRRWLHNRDWDHMQISDKEGMKLWNNYYEFINNEEEIFDNEIKFNNKGYWQFNKTNDKSIIATQLFMKYIKDNNYTLDFNENLNCYTIPIRL